MARPQGQIIRRGDALLPDGKRVSRWLVRVYDGTDENGKRQYRNATVKGTRKEAQARLTELLKEKHDTGTILTPSAEVMSDYLKRWLKVAAGRVTPRTLHDYESVIRRYITPAFGQRPLRDVTPLQVQTLYADMQQRGLSAGTINHVHAVLSSAMKQAFLWREIRENPMLRVKAPRIRRKEVQALTPEQARAFLAVADADRFAAYWHLLLTTGMRPGEALALRWSDVRDGRVQVQRALSYRAGVGKRIQEPKTRQSRRSVPLTDGTLRLLEAHRRKQAAEKLAAGPHYNDQGLIFCTITGELYDAHRMSRRFKKLLAAADLPDIRMYDLRHTCATLLLGAGEHLKVMAERLGHASITLTANTYSHVLPDMQRAATDKLAQVLGA